jgi:hypothetical protein
MPLGHATSRARFVYLSLLHFFIHVALPYAWCTSLLLRRQDSCSLRCWTFCTLPHVCSTLLLFQLDQWYIVWSLLQVWSTLSPSELDLIILLCVKIAPCFIFMHSPPLTTKFGHPSQLHFFVLDLCSMLIIIAYSLARFVHSLAEQIFAYFLQPAPCLTHTPVCLDLGIRIQGEHSFLCFRASSKRSRWSWVSLCLWAARVKRSIGWFTRYSYISWRSIICFTSIMFSLSSLVLFVGVWRAPKKYR